MDNYVIVRPEHLNHQGYLFGGALLKWVDEFAWIAASLDFPGCVLVTIAMDRIVFRQRVENGGILRFSAHVRTGTTSTSYSVDVFEVAADDRPERHIFSTAITFVRLNEAGVKQPLPPRRGHESARRRPAKSEKTT